MNIDKTQTSLDLRAKGLDAKNKIEDFNKIATTTPKKGVKIKK